MEAMGFKLEKGERPLKPGEVVLGQYAAYNFRDTLRPEGLQHGGPLVRRWNEDTGKLNDPPPAYFDPLKEPLVLEAENGEYKTSLTLKPVALAKEDYSKGMETGEGVLMDLKDLKVLTEKLHLVKRARRPTSRCW